MLTNKTIYYLSDDKIVKTEAFLDDNVFKTVFGKSDNNKAHAKIIENIAKCDRKRKLIFE